MSDLIVDPQIRCWVFLPTIILTFLLGIFRHYISILLEEEPTIQLQQVQDSQMILRSVALRENCKYIPKSSFLTRKKFFNHETTGCLKQQRPPPDTNSTMSCGKMSDMLKRNISTVLPTVVICSWIDWMLSGSITTKVPFPLTMRFKPMLQHGIDLVQLEASWVSSASWYFLNVFGLKNLYMLVLGEENSADQTRQIQDNVSGVAQSMSMDVNAIFKAEWEALEIVDYEWGLKDVHCDF